MRVQLSVTHSTLCVHGTDGELSLLSRVYRGQFHQKSSRISRDAARPDCPTPHAPVGPATERVPPSRQTPRAFCFHRFRCWITSLIPGHLPSSGRLSSGYIWSVAGGPEVATPVAVGSYFAEPITCVLALPSCRLRRVSNRPGVDPQRRGQHPAKYGH